MSYEVDPDEYPDTAITAGFYEAKIARFERKTSASSGNEMIAIELEIPECNGRILYDNLVLTAKANWKIASFARAVGVPGKVDYQNDDQFRLLFVGQYCRIRVTIENRDGKERPRVAAYLPADPSKPKTKRTENNDAPSSPDDDAIPF